MTNIALDRRTVGQSKAIVLYVVSIGIGLYGLNKLSKLQLPPHLAGAGQSQFLTNLSLAASLVTFGLGLLAHLTKSDTLYRIKNVVHTFAFVAEAVVATVYWPLRIMFLELLVKEGAIRIELLTDLSIHLMPVASLAIDFFFFMPNFQIPAFAVFIGCLCLTTGYWFWLDSIIDFENGGAFPYEFLKHEDKRITTIVFWSIGMSAFLQFFIMRFLYGVFVKEKKKVE